MDTFETLARQAELSRPYVRQAQPTIALAQPLGPGYRSPGAIATGQTDLDDVWFAGKVPKMEEYRRYFGASVTWQTIEQCIRSAACGYMRDITDLSYESLLVDPHVSTCVGKRMRAVAHVDYIVEPAKGEGINPEKAALYADVVREQLAWIPGLRQRLVQLGWGHYHGRAALEKCWAETTGRQLKYKWRLDNLFWIHPRRLALGPDREVRIRDDIWQGGGFEKRGFDTREVPEKFVVFTPQLFNEYAEREGLAPRTLYFSLFKRVGWRFRMQLLERWGQPWGIVEVEKDANVQQEQLERAKQTADQMGSHASVAMPKGVHFRLEHPAEGGAEMHQNVAQDCDDQMSKLVLGTTRTVDSKPDALGGDAGRVGQDGEYLIFASDCWNVSDAATEQLAAHIIALNYGPEEVAHAPRIKLPYEIKPSRTEEIERTGKTLSLGIPIKLEEVYERTGFTKPGPGDATIQQTAGGGGGLLGPSGPTIEIKDPENPGGGTPAPATPPTPAPDPNAPKEAPDAAEPDTDDIEVQDASPRVIRFLRQSLDAGLRARARYGELVTCAAQPETVNGSPDVLVDTGVKEAARLTSSWGATLAEATEGIEEPGAIFEALQRAASTLPIAKFARATERRMLHGLMLGALDSSWEVENEALIAIESFAFPRLDAQNRVLRPAADYLVPLVTADGEWEQVLAKDLQPGDPDRKFVARPFEQAAKLFKDRQVLTEDRFAQLTAAAKRRAFTIAKLARQELLSVAHAELGRQMETGQTSLPGFRQLVKDRLETAGWTPSNPSHVETIFRTNVLGGYGAGRHAQMTEPATLAVRPVWQWMSVRDDRARENHKRAHGTVLPANHAFWKTAYPPAGYSCRCRVVSRGKAWADKVTGVPTGLPDDGFDSSGTTNLLTADL